MEDKTEPWLKMGESNDTNTYVRTRSLVPKPIISGSQINKRSILPTIIIENQQQQ